MASFSKRKQLVGLIFWLVLCYTTSFIGAIASIQAKSFYTQLIQPSWAPQPTIFGPVWSTLYALMAVAAWFVWRNGGFRSNFTSLSLFLLQLVLNGLWSWMFFAWYQGALAFVNILLLWIFLLLTLITFWRVRPLAGVLLIPYLLWVSFASFLSYALWKLNPQILG